MYITSIQKVLQAPSIAARFNLVIGVLQERKAMIKHACFGASSTMMEGRKRSSETGPIERH